MTTLLNATAKIEGAATRLALAAGCAAAALLTTACAHYDELRPGHPMDPATFKFCDAREFDTPPTLLEGNAPVYPAEDRRAGKEGAAMVDFVVNVDGSTTVLQSMSNEDKYFAGHAALAIRDWKFKAATRDGAPVTTRCSIELTFSKPDL